MTTSAPAEPDLNVSPSLAQVPHIELTINMSPSPTLLSPNDASIILLLATKAKGDNELEAQLKESILANPDLDLSSYSIEELSPVNRLTLRFYQQIQKQHGFPVDPAICDQATKASWRNSHTRFTDSYIAPKTLEFLYASQRSDQDSKPFPLFRLPLELRREVYRYALAGDCRRVMVFSMDLDFFRTDYERHRLHGGDPWYGDRSHPHWQNPSFTFRSAIMGRGIGISTAILRTSRAIHEEAEALLYQLHEFDFYIDVFCVVPFLRSISHNARQNISCLTMYLHDMNGTPVGPYVPLRAEVTSRQNLVDWGPACSYIAQNVRLREFAFHIQQEAPEELQHLSWVQDMAQIKVLRKLMYYETGVSISHEKAAKLGPDDEDWLTTGISGGQHTERDWSPTQERGSDSRVERRGKPGRDEENEDGRLD